MDAQGMQYWVSGFCHRDQRVCVEVAWSATGVLLRDSKQGTDGEQLVVSFREWGFTLDHIRSGLYDYDRLPLAATPPRVIGRALAFARNRAGDVSGNGDVWISGVTRTGVPTTLTFSEAELAAFIAGVHDGQFDTAESPGRVPSHIG